MIELDLPIRGPHQGIPLTQTGTPLGEAKAAMVLVHGRDADALRMISLLATIDLVGFAYLAPQAANNQWFPYPLTAESHLNEPFLSSGITAVSETITTAEQAGIPPEKVLLLGFSQGATLVLDYWRHNLRPFGGVVALSGGLSGSTLPKPERVTTADNTPLFLASSEDDIHVPLTRVLETADFFQTAGATVATQFHAGVHHIVRPESLAVVGEMMATLLAE